VKYLPWIAPRLLGRRASEEMVLFSGTHSDRILSAGPQTVNMYVSPQILA
jgi:hypothetical protein